MQIKKVSSTLGLGYMIAGVCFLISPLLAVMDVLPDFIGYALILKGIYCLADMDERISEASRLFRRLLILGLVRMGLVLFIYGMAAKSEQPTLQLLCSFVLTVLDCMAIVPAWRALCSGLIYLATRLEGKAVFDKRYPASRKKIYAGGKTLTEKTFAFTTIFLVVREVLSTLPEFAVLSHQMGGADPGNRTAIYDFIGLMRGMCALIVLIWGLVWLCKIIRYIRHIMKDQPFMEALRHKYEAEVLTRPELFARRGVKSALVLLCVGYVLTVDLFLDDVCVTPDMLFGIFCIVSLLLLKKYVSSKALLPALLSSGAYIAVTAVEWILQLDYFPLSDGASVYRKGEVYTAWVHMNFIRVAAILLGLLTLFFIIKVLFEAIERYTGFSITQKDSQTPNERVKEVHEALRSRLWICYLLFTLASIASLVYLLTLPVASETLWEVWGLADLVITGISAACFIHTVFCIFEQIDYKYMLS